MLKKLVQRLVTRRAIPESLTYEEAREILESQSLKARTELAQHNEVKPEMLYYLASDQAAETRALVAANEKTPIKADKILACDPDDDVRSELAKKISRLVPTLSSNETEKLREQAIDILDQLAQDHLPRVRKIIAEEIKKSNNVPKDIVLKLAQDIEAIVSAPILEYSPLLSDEDLLEITAGGAASGALEAIAKRKSVSNDVSDAIVATLDVPAVAALLVNPNAQIREETLDQIIDSAESIEDWHQPLTLRPDLSGRAVKRIAGFVASSLLQILSERNDLEEDALTEVRARVAERIKHEKSLDKDSEAEIKHAKEMVKQAKQNGRLNDDFIQAAAENGSKLIVVHGLAELSQKPPSFVSRVLNSKQGKAVTSLSWLSGLSMRTALMLQTHIARIPPTGLVMARNGVEYPLTNDEMNWHLTYFSKSV